jgi:hypothetical protein
VTTLAVSAVLQETFSVDAGSVYDGDPLYTLWLAEVVAQAADIREAEHRRVMGGH